MSTSLSCGDVVILKNGSMGVVRQKYIGQKYDTMVIEVKGKPTNTSNTTINNNTSIRIKLKKNCSNIDIFKKLSGECIFDKLSVVHDVIAQDNVHKNKYNRLKINTKLMKEQLLQKNEKIHLLKEKIKKAKKLLLLQQSVWTITHPRNIDKTSTPVLLLTYPEFTTSSQLLNCILQRFFYLNKDDHDQQLDNPVAQLDIQIKCSLLVQEWMRLYWNEDFYYNPSLIQLIKTEFIAKISQIYPNNIKYIELQNMIKQTMDYQRQQDRQRSSRILKKKQTFSKLVEKLEELKDDDDDNDIKMDKNDIFQNMDNFEIAQQITLIDFDNFAAISPRECLGKQWLNETDKYTLSPNICEMINSLNKVFKWTQITILLSPHVDKRGRLIKKFIKICRQLLKLNNFHSLSAIFGALRSTPVWQGKLKYAWNKVPDKHLKFYEKLKKLFDTKKNMKNLRNKHKLANAPIVPYTGIFLTELVGIEEAGKNYTKKPINFKKLVQIAQSIENVLIFQKTPYTNIKQNVAVQHYLNTNIFNDNTISDVNEDNLYVFSTVAAKQDAENIRDRTRSSSRPSSLSLLIKNKLKKT